MGDVQKISIELGEDLIDEMRARLAQGQIESWDSFIAEALIDRFGPPRESIEEIRRSIEDGIAKGEWIEGNFDYEDIKRRGRERLAQRQ